MDREDKLMCENQNQNQNQNELTLEELMAVAEKRDVKGIVANGLAFKTENGCLYTWVKKSGEWIKPHITSAWFHHKFSIVKF